MFGQGEQLIIGRTTGVFNLDDDSSVRIFGFTNTLSGQVDLPGITLEAMVGDSVTIDFWNISQGDPHTLFIDGIELRLTDEDGLPLKEETIHHMEHGYYHFRADRPGTYMYYCPENYPFNVQAGMFGILIVRPNEKSVPKTPKHKEILWCSFEMDTTWHNDSIMEIERSKSFFPVENPSYNPQYFLINGSPVDQIEAVDSFGKRNKEPILIRIQNTGQWQHEISFPEKLTIEKLSGDDAILTTSAKTKKLILKPKENCELLVYAPKRIIDLNIQYDFRNPETNKIEHTGYIPVK